MILHCAVKDLGIKTIISSSIEHHAILHALDSLKLLHGIEVLYVNLLDDGSIDLNNLAFLITKRYF